jgi:hypothetical protein
MTPIKSTLLLFVTFLAIVHSFAPPSSIPLLNHQSLRRSSGSGGLTRIHQPSVSTELGAFGFRSFFSSFFSLQSSNASTSAAAAEPAQQDDSAEFLTQYMLKSQAAIAKKNDEIKAAKREAAMAKDQLALSSGGTVSQALG